MLIKEYRIPLPMSVEEYRIAQLYMIQKKSRLDSTGEGSGVEIIENRPYTNGPGGSGQYTKKIYHIGNHIPGWLKAIVPKSALQVIEEAWNAYPYTKMKTTCPFVEKFYVDVETKYLPDNGSKENVFNLSPSELSNQSTDLIDPVKDPIPASQYSKEEDPLLYVSKKTGRGPLTPDWRQQPQESVMCAYKRITVEFKYWGMQRKIEQFIHDGLRKPMLMGHRQAWVWQDEWFGLTINDIRELEKDTQRMLAKKMGHVSDLNLNQRLSDRTEENSKNDTIRPLRDIPVQGSAIELLSQESVDREELSRVSLSDQEGKPSFGFRIGSVTSSDSEQEFYDAQDVFDSEPSDDECNDSFLRANKPFDQNSHSGGSVESLDSYISNHREEEKPQKKRVGKTMSYGSSASSNSASSCRINVLVLVVHGGNPLETSSDVKSKENDFERLVREFYNVMQNHYKEGKERVAFQLVGCPQVFKDALPALKDITPQLMDEHCSEEGQGSPIPSFNFPVSSLPLLAACSSDFQEMVDGTITKANEVYREFLNSEAGLGFTGEVCIVGDCIGALLAYEALCLQWGQESFDTDTQSSTNGPPFSPATSPRTPNQRPILGKFRRQSEQAPPPGTALATGRLSSSDVDIRSAVSAVDHRRYNDGGFDDLEESKRAFRQESTGSVSVEDALDDASSVSHAIPLGHVKKFEFETSKFFAFGSPIGLVLLYKRFSQFSSAKGPPVKPACSQFYNLFHPFDPLSSRIEPLILSEFSQMSPVDVPRYQKFPLGDGVSNDVMTCISRRKDLFNNKTTDQNKKKVERQESNISTCSAMSLEIFDSAASEQIRQGLRGWWGNNRIDYALYNPKSLHQLPLSVLCPLFHISYWESKDVVGFILRQILDISSSTVIETSDGKRRERRFSSFHIPNPREKWVKKRTAYKIKNLASNHRANDAIALEGCNQIISARFTYGPLDVAALTGEKVDVYIMSYPPAGEWNFIETMITGNGGRGWFTVPDEKKFDVGIYPVKMVVRGDHTTVDCSLAVLPPKTEAVVFSIDGSFSASVSLRGRHPKVQPGAVDVVRHWQEQGYLIIYVTSRPDFQKHQVMLWIAEHNFPFGLVSFCGSLSTVDIQRHKSEYLRNLTSNLKVIIHAAYGSSKDIAVYSGVGLEPNAIFVIGKNSSRRNEKQATYLRDGYANHLASLANDPISRPAGNSRLTLRRGCFGLPKKPKHISKRASTVSKVTLK